VHLVLHSLADAEVEYAGHTSPSIYVAFVQSDPAAWEARGFPRAPRW
jgi:isoleucyl-tRNA synthetase